MSSSENLKAADSSVIYSSLGLPYSERLDIHCLASAFQNVTNSYKFYWFLAIIEELKFSQQESFSFDQLTARMLSLVWFPVNYFRLSLGKQDKLSQLIEGFRQQTKIPRDEKAQTVYIQCLRLIKGNEHSALQKEIQNRARYVPYRFLRPWLNKELKGVKESKLHQVITQTANHRFANSSHSLPFYRFLDSKKGIELHPDWIDYIEKHFKILRDFCLWNLTLYLQKNNPNVPGIPSKLFPRETRDLKLAKQFWESTLQNSSSTFPCIYSGADLKQAELSYDHFLPWSFVVHDQVWNIIPTSRSINSSKSDNIPCLDTYFSQFASRQYQALQKVGKQNKNRLLEDHLLLFKEQNTKALLAIPEPDFTKTLRQTLAPQTQLAKNMGFQTEWKYNSPNLT